MSRITRRKFLGSTAAGFCAGSEKAEAIPERVLHPRHRSDNRPVSSRIYIH